MNRESVRSAVCDVPKANTSESRFGNFVADIVPSIIAVLATGLVTACASSSSHHSKLEATEASAGSVDSHLFATATPGMTPVAAESRNRQASAQAGVLESDASQRYLASVAVRWKPLQHKNDRDRDGVVDESDDCPNTSLHVTVNRLGCGLFDGVLDRVAFASGSLWLEFDAKDQLDMLAQRLSTFPESRVQIRAHTDSQGSARMNLELSARRAEIVAQYLHLNGVNWLQLQAIGVGETEPRGSNDTSKERSANRRVDVVTLAELGNYSPKDTVQVAAGRRFDSTDKQRVQADGVIVVPVSSLFNKTQVASRASASSAPVAHSAGADSGKPADRDTLGSLESAVVALGAGKNSAGVAGSDVHDSPSASLPIASAASAIRASKKVSAGKFAEIRSLGNELALLGRVAYASPRQPLPAPGIAPDFPVHGVLSGVDFAIGSSDLSEQARQSLQPILRALVNDKAVRVAIMVHTDNTGGTATNQALSVRRADSVAAYLVDGGITKTRLKPEGFGESLPLVQNVTDADRARNRRVEVRILAKGN